MSHKIKLSLKGNSKPIEDLPNEKISIPLSKKKNINSTILSSEPEKATRKLSQLSKPIVLDHQLFKQFKNSTYSKIDLHGLTVDEAHQNLLLYVKKNFSQKKLPHIVITGLGNKANNNEFFTGKIRKSFPLWLETDLFKEYIKTYSPCKIQHGGLGAFYIKLKTKE